MVLKIQNRIPIWVILSNSYIIGLATWQLILRDKGQLKSVDTMFGMTNVLGES